MRWLQLIFLGWTVFTTVNPLPTNDTPPSQRRLNFRLPDDSYQQQLVRPARPAQWPYRRRPTATIERLTGRPPVPVVQPPAPPPAPPPAAQALTPPYRSPPDQELLRELLNLHRKKSETGGDTVHQPHVDTFNVVVTTNGTDNTTPKVTVLPPGSQVGIMRVLDLMAGQHKVGDQRYKVEEATAQLIKHPNSDLVMATLNNSMADKDYLQLIMRGLIGQKIDPNQPLAMLNRRDVDQSYLSHLLNTTIRRNNQFYVNSTSKTNVVNIYVINIVAEDDNGMDKGVAGAVQPPPSMPTSSYITHGGSPMSQGGSASFSPPIASTRPRPHTYYSPPTRPPPFPLDGPLAPPSSHYGPATHPPVMQSPSPSRPSFHYGAPTSEPAKQEHSPVRPSSHYGAPTARPLTGYQPPKKTPNTHYSQPPPAGLRPPAAPATTTQATTRDPLYHFTVTISPRTTTTTPAPVEPGSPLLNRHNMTVGSILSLLPNVFPAASNAFANVPFPNVSAVEEGNVLKLLPHDFDPANPSYAEMSTVNPMKEIFGHDYDYKHSLSANPLPMSPSRPFAVPNAAESDSANTNPVIVTTTTTNNNVLGTLMPTVAAGALAFSPLWLPLFLGRKKRSTQIITPGHATPPGSEVRAQIPQAWLGYLRGYRHDGSSLRSRFALDDRPAIPASQRQKQSKAEVMSRPLTVLDPEQPGDAARGTAALLKENLLPFSGQKRRPVLEPQQKNAVSQIITKTMNGGFSNANTAASVSERYPGLQGYEALQQGVINSIQTLRDKISSQGTEGSGEDEEEAVSEEEMMDVSTPPMPDIADTTNSPITFITLSTAAQTYGQFQTEMEQSTAPKPTDQMPVKNSMVESMMEMVSGPTTATPVEEPVTFAPRPRPPLRPRPIPTILSQGNADDVSVTLTTTAAPPTTTAAPPTTMSSSTSAILNQPSSLATIFGVNRPNPAFLLRPTKAPNVERRPTVFFNNQPMFPATVATPVRNAGIVKVSNEDVIKVSGTANKIVAHWGSPPKRTTTRKPKPVSNSAVPMTSTKISSNDHSSGNVADLVKSATTSSSTSTTSTTSTTPSTTTTSTTTTTTTTTPATTTTTTTQRPETFLEALGRAIPIMAGVVVAGGAAMLPIYFAFGKRRRRRRSAETSEWPIDLDAVFGRLLNANESYGQDSPKAGADTISQSKSLYRKHGKKYIPSEKAKRKID